MALGEYRIKGAAKIRGSGQGIIGAVACQFKMQKLTVTLMTAVLVALMINVEVVSAQTSAFNIPLGQAALTGAAGVAVDGDGNIYVAQLDVFAALLGEPGVTIGVHQVAKLGPDGSEILRIGTFGSGAGQFDFSRGEAGVAVVVAGVAVDSAGNIYVADTENYRIQKFDRDGNFLLMWGFGVQDGANVFQICMSSCRQGIRGSGAGQFNRPQGVAVDNAGEVSVVDYNTRRIQKFDADGQVT